MYTPLERQAPLWPKTTADQTRITRKGWVFHLCLKSGAQEPPNGPRGAQETPESNLKIRISDSYDKSPCRKCPLHWKIEAFLKRQAARRLAIHRLHYTSSTPLHTTPMGSLPKRYGHFVARRNSLSVTLHYITLCYIMLHYITLRGVTLHFITIQYSTVLYFTMQYKTTPYHTIQHKTIPVATPHKTMLHY